MLEAAKAGLEKLHDRIKELEAKNAKWERDFDFAIAELAEANDTNRKIRTLQIMERDKRIEELEKEAHYKDMHISTLEGFKSKTLEFLTDIRADCPHEWEKLDRVIQLVKGY